MDGVFGVLSIVALVVVGILVYDARVTRRVRAENARRRAAWEADIRDAARRRMPPPPPPNRVERRL